MAVPTQGAFVEPARVLMQLNCSAGQTLADFGAGSGAYVLAAAPLVGERGKVYAIDVQKELLPTILSKAKDANQNNVEVLWGNVEEPNGSKLASGSMDHVLISNLLFQAENKEAVLREALRVLKPGGTLLLVDWADSFGGLGPKDVSIITAEAAQKLASTQGFAVSDPIDAGAHHWAFVAQKPASEAQSV